MDWIRSTARYHFLPTVASLVRACSARFSVFIEVGICEFFPRVRWLLRRS
jgi:hypothetical protein